MEEHTTTTCRPAHCTSVQETGVSRHHGVSIESPPEAPNITMVSRVLRGTFNSSPLCREAEPLIAEVNISSLANDFSAGRNR